MKIDVKEFDPLKYCRDYKVPGFTYCLIKGGKAGEPVAVGVKNAETGVPMEKNTTFEAASVTKTMFATLCMRLVERGELELDRPVREYYDEEGYTEDPMFADVTPRLCLCHGTGLPNWSARPVPFLFKPGTSYSYSGEGYYYLHRAVNHFTGKDFVDHFADEFFKPLGMNDSAAIWNEHIYSLEANSHDAEGKVQELRYGVDGAGLAPEPNSAWSLYTTAGDYAKFMELVINECAGLKPETFAEMHKKQNKVSDNMYWGLGFGIPAKDENVIWHWGDNGGFKNLIAMDLETKDGVCIFSNGFNGNKMECQLMKELTDGVFWDDVDEFIANAE